MTAEEQEKYNELEERLNKATNVFKTQKAELDNANARIKELEDEITINGNSSEEIKALNERIEKAKTIFKEQKEKIASLSENNEKLNIENDDLKKRVIEDNEIIKTYKNAIQTIKVALNTL